jgi:hypothetical protein
MNRRRMKVVIVVGSLLCAGCGSGVTTGAPSDIPSGDVLGALSPTQSAELCDWINGQQGGYGRSVH